MSPLEIASLAIIGVGLILMLGGLFLAFRESRRSGDLGLVTGFMERLQKLVETLSKQRGSLVLFTFGVLLVFIGAVMLAPASLAA